MLWFENRRSEEKSCSCVFCTLCMHLSVLETSQHCSLSESLQNPVYIIMKLFHPEWFHCLVRLLHVLAMNIWVTGHHASKLKSHLQTTKRHSVMNTVNNNAKIKWPRGWAELNNAKILQEKLSCPILRYFKPQCPLPPSPLMIIKPLNTVLIFLVRSLLWSWGKIGLLWILNKLETVTTSVPFLNPESQPDLLSSRSLTLTLHRYEKMGVLWKARLMQTWQWVWANTSFWKMFIQRLFQTYFTYFWGGGLGYN